MTYGVRDDPRVQKFTVPFPLYYGQNLHLPRGGAYNVSVRRGGETLPAACQQVTHRMLWLGLRGRRKLELLDLRAKALEEAVEKLEKDFRALDLEMTNHVDRLTGIAKRFTGRQGGRPPGKPNGHADAEAEDTPASEGAPFSRHVL